MLIFYECKGPGGTTRKLRHDIIYLSRSIRLSKRAFHCAFGTEDVIIVFELYTHESHIVFIYIVTVCNQVWIPVASFDFSVKEYPKRIFIIHYRAKHPMQSTNLDLHKIMFVLLFPSQIVRSRNDRTEARDIVTY